MNHALEIQLKPAEGALLRILGLIECRGFRLDNVHLQTPVAGQHQLSLVVNSPHRNIDVLRRQVMRLIDVVNVTVSASESQPKAAAVRSARSAIVNEVSTWMR